MTILLISFTRSFNDCVRSMIIIDWCASFARSMIFNCWVPSFVHSTISYRSMIFIDLFLSFVRSLISFVRSFDRSRLPQGAAFRQRQASACSGTIRSGETRCVCVCPWFRYAFVRDLSGDVHVCAPTIYVCVCPWFGYVCAHGLEYVHCPWSMYVCPCMCPWLDNLRRFVFMVRVYVHDVVCVSVIYTRVSPTIYVCVPMLCVRVSMNSGFVYVCPCVYYVWYVNGLCMYMCLIPMAPARPSTHASRSLRPCLAPPTTVSYVPIVTYV